MIFSDTILRICNEQASVRCAAKPEPNMMITPLLLSLWNKPTTSGFPDDVLRGGICGEQLPPSVPIRGSVGCASSCIRLTLTKGTPDATAFRYWPGLATLSFGGGLSRAVKQTEEAPRTPTSHRGRRPENSRILA